MDATIEHRSSGALAVPVTKKAPSCPWRGECILARENVDEFSNEGCSARLKKAACKWLLREEGYTAICLIKNKGEIPVKKIGDWFGFGDDVAKLARVREKLNVLVEWEILAFRRGPTKQGENLYCLGSKASPVMQQSIAKYNARCKAIEDERKALLSRAGELVRLLEKMKRLKLS